MVSARPKLHVVGKALAPEPRVFPHDPDRRGYVVQYRGAETPCPGCGRSNWEVRRLTAECGFCHTALPIVEPSNG